MAYKIILAKTEDDARVIDERRRDLGESPRYEYFKRPVTMFWLRNGSDADIEKAKEFANKEGYSVFAFPTCVRESEAIAEVERQILIGA